MLPKLFALTRTAGNDERHIVGYGMVLPDGSAHSVSWPTHAASVYSASSADEIAELRGADLLWLGGPIVRADP